MLKLKTMKDYGIRGLECFYSRYSIEESEFLVNCAKANNLLISAGSDYHGTNKSNIEIGKLNINRLPIGIEKINILEYL